MSSSSGHRHELAIATIVGAAISFTVPLTINTVRKVFLRRQEPSEKVDTAQLQVLPLAENKSALETLIPDNADLQNAKRIAKANEDRLDALERKVNHIEERAMLFIVTDRLAWLTVLREII
eukprot:IDg13810t1